MSTRVLAVLALLGLFLTANAAPADAARSAKKAPGASEKKSAREKKARKGSDTSLRGRFAKIPTPRVPGASKIRLELKPAEGDGKRGRVFRKSKLKLGNGAGPTFKQKVMASTRKNTRRRR